MTGQEPTGVRNGYLFIYLFICLSLESGPLRETSHYHLSHLALHVGWLCVVSPAKGQRGGKMDSADRKRG